MWVAQRAVDIANTARMLRTQHRGALLIVESPRDLNVYGRMLDGRSCRLLPAMSRNLAVDAIRLLEGERFPGCVAIVDRDFSHLAGETLGSANVFVTDLHDLESMILASPALEKVLAEFGSAPKLANTDVRAVLLDAGRLIGCLRLISLKGGLNLTFEGLSFGEFVDRDSLKVDIGALIASVKNKSRRPDIAERVLAEEVIDCARRYDPWDVSNGHDLTAVLSVGLRKRFGSRDAGEVRVEVIERSLRLAYEGSFFAPTKLRAALRAWEADNPDYRLFPA